MREIVPRAGLTDQVTPEVELPVTAAVNCWDCEVVRETEAGETVTATFCPWPIATPWRSKEAANKRVTDMPRPARVGRRGLRGGITRKLALVNINFIVLYAKTLITSIDRLRADFSRNVYLRYILS